MAPSIRMLVVAASIAACTLPAQAPDPHARPVVVCVQLEDGTPVPGVPIARDGGAPVRDAEDGWLRERDDEFRFAWLPVVGRSDPDGKLTLLANHGRFGQHELQAAAPFRTKLLVPAGEGFVLRVERLDHYVVRAVDAAGEPLVDFPLALQHRGRNHAVAVTDARGVATFGVDPTTAQFTVVPFGWIGPTDGFPTVAQQMPDKRVELAVPPFGLARVRATIDCVAKSVRLHSVQVNEPRRATLHPRHAKELHGVELGPIAVGHPLQGSMWFDIGEVSFAVPAVRRHGEMLVVDVDADPVRPRLALQLVAPGLRLAKPGGHDGEARVQVRVVVAVRTDAGCFSFEGQLGDDGRLTVKPGIGALPGARVQRVDVDVTETDMGPGSATAHGVPHANPHAAAANYRPRWSPRVWSGTLALDRAIEPTTLDLGTIEVERHYGQLQGQVVDMRGQPVARASVVVTAEATHASLTTRTDHRGEFAFLQPLLRDEQGRPATVVASASLGWGPDARYSEPSAPTAAGGSVTLVLASQPQGHLQFSLRAPAALPPRALQFAFVDANGGVRELGTGRFIPGAQTPTWSLGPVPTGRGTLRILLRPGVPLRSVDGVEIRAGEACVDPRLQGVDLSDVVSTCRVRVVDEHGVPIAGACLEYRGASDPWSIGPSDGSGVLEVLSVSTGALRVVASAPGKQPGEVAELRDGADIRLRPLQYLGVALRGLPADVPRADVHVALRSAALENLTDFVDGPLGEGDTARLPLPSPGSYHVRIGLRQPGGSGWYTVGERTEDVRIGKDGGSIEFVVDDAMVQRMRELLARK